jgi:uncharacterized protein (DUF2267 family)
VGNILRRDCLLRATSETETKSKIRSPRPPRADALRDGLSDTEAAMIEASLPANLRALWSRKAGPHPGLADLGDIGFLGRVQELAASPSDDETKRMVSVVMTVLMTAMAIPAGDRRAAWSALTHLPRESKRVWMKLFRAACFPVELYASDP